MTNEEREIQRKLRVLQHAGKIGNARKACRYFGVGRSSFYRWRDACQKFGEAGLKNAKSIPKSSEPNTARDRQTPPNTARDRRKGPLSSAQISPRPDQNYLVSGTLSRHQNLGCWCLPIGWQVIVERSLRSEFSGAMVSIGFPEAHECANCTPNVIKNRSRVITYKSMLSF